MSALRVVLHKHFFEPLSNSQFGDLCRAIQETCQAHVINNSASLDSVRTFFRRAYCGYLNSPCTFWQLELVWSCQHKLQKGPTVGIRYVTSNLCIMFSLLPYVCKYLACNVCHTDFCASPDMQLHFWRRTSCGRWSKRYSKRQSQDVPRNGRGHQNDCEHWLFCIDSRKLTKENAQSRRPNRLGFVVVTHWRVASLSDTCAFLLTCYPLHALHVQYVPFGCLLNYQTRDKAPTFIFFLS